MSSTNSRYYRKLEILTDFTKYLLNNLPINDRLIYIDGGELTGTTTHSKKVVELINKYPLRIDSSIEPCVYSREPSLKCKEEIIIGLSHQNLLENPGEKVDYIIDVFTKDRKENQNNTPNNQLKISDRGLFSTIIYQSGILSDDVSEETLVENIKKIQLAFNKYKIRLPLMFFNLISLDNRHLDIEVFNDRLDRRKASGEKLDGMDVIEKVITIHNVYTDLTLNLIKDDIDYRSPIYGIDFKDGLIIGVHITDIIYELNSLPFKR